MDIKRPYLFLEVNDNQFIFLVVKYSEDLSFEILYSTSLKSAGVKDGKIIDTEIAFKTIKENLDILEKKLKYTFKSTTIINDQYNFDCINISGFKKLGGSQILDEDISYILNDIKKSISDNEPKKTLIHLFNTNFVLDQTALNNLPIGLHGEFYNHHLTFFLLPKNDLKNLKVILNKCNLNIERIVLKPFTSGIDKINRNETKEIFCTIGLGKEKSNISIFKDLSFAYSENFLFGTEMIKKDISKLCSLENIDYLKTNSPNDSKTVSFLSQRNPDLVLSIGSVILKDEFIEIPAIGVLNVHMGILPEYRGIGVTEWPILEAKENNKIKLGVTLHFIERGVDTGPILLKRFISTEGITDMKEIDNKYLPIMAEVMTEGVQMVRNNEYSQKTQASSSGKQYFFLHDRMKQKAKNKLLRMNIEN